MFYMVVYPGEQFYCLAAVSFDDLIIRDKDFYPFRSGQGREYAAYFGRKKQQKLSPVERRII